MRTVMLPSSPINSTLPIITIFPSCPEIEYLLPFERSISLRQNSLAGGSRLVGPKPDQLPVAVEFLARPFDEGTLFAIASAYEAGTKHRHPPAGFGPLPGEP
jgi:hypothetical protein